MNVRFFRGEEVDSEKFRGVLIPWQIVHRVHPQFPSILKEDAAFPDQGCVHLPGGGGDGDPFYARLGLDRDPLEGQNPVRSVERIRGGEVVQQVGEQDRERYLQGEVGIVQVKGDDRDPPPARFPHKDKGGGIGVDQHPSPIRERYLFGLRDVDIAPLDELGQGVVRHERVGELIGDAAHLKQVVCGRVHDQEVSRRQIAGNNAVEYVDAKGGIGDGDLAFGVWHNAEGGEVGKEGEKLFEEEVAFRDKEYVAVDRRGVDGEGDVVEGEVVYRFCAFGGGEAGFVGVRIFGCGREVGEGEGLAVVGGDLQAFGGVERTVNGDGEDGEAVGVAVIGDAGEKFGAFGGGAEGEGGDGEVIGRFTNGDVFHLTGQGGQSFGGQAPVRNDESGGVYGLASGGSGGEGEGGLPVYCTLNGRGIREGLGEQVFVIFASDQDFGLVGDEDEGHGRIGVEAGDHAPDDIEGGGKAGGLDIGRLHGGGRVEQDDHGASRNSRDGDGRAREGKHQPREDQELEEQEEVAAEFLPGRVRLPIPQNHLPEHGGGDFHFLPA